MFTLAEKERRHEAIRRLIDALNLNAFILIGHVCGVDLVDDRVSLQKSMLLEPGMAVIIHPTIFTPDGKRSFFWGETYLVTKDGYERLHQTGDELLTL